MRGLANSERKPENDSETRRFVQARAFKFETDLFLGEALFRVYAGHLPKWYVLFLVGVVDLRRIDS